MRQRLWVAAAIALFLLPLLPLAPAQSTTDPWWGPSDKSKPTEGYAIRIPVTVENKFDYTMFDPFVGVELDLSKLLVEAGWTNQTVGTDTRLRGFTLDVDSIRVVEYNRGFVTGPIGGSGAPAIPHVFYPALLEAPRFREFDAARNPAGTVLFQIDGGLARQAKRDFYIYANPLEYTDTAPPVFDALARSPLDAFLWGTSGNVHYGWEPQQIGQRHFLQIASLSQTGVTTATVSTFELGSFRPIASTTTYPNPLVLQPGATTQYFIPAGRAYKIEADRPISVYAIGQKDTNPSGAEQAGFVPGMSGSFADDSFLFYYAGPSNAIRITKASPGAVTVQSQVEQVSLSNGVPTGAIKVFGGTGANFAGWVQLFGSGKFLVSVPTGVPQGGTDPVAFPMIQVPATTGGPSGNDFYSLVLNGNDDGFIRLCPDDNASIRLVDYPAGTLQLFPEGTLPNVPPATFEPKLFCEDVAVPRSASTANPYEFYSVLPDNAPAGAKVGNFRAWVGAGERLGEDEMNLTRPFLGAVGGLAGIDYDLFGRSGLFGHYNDTRITIFEEKQRSDGTTFATNRTRALQRDEFYTLLPDEAGGSTGRFHVVATKPIAATSLNEAMYKEFSADTNEFVDKTIPYALHVPGRPVMPSITVGAADFRGPLVEIRSPETDGRQLFRSTGPGSPITFRLDVLNLGRWNGGEDLPDTITISCSTPAGWTVEGCAKEVTLGSRSAERLSVVVTPAADDVNATRTILVEARSKTGGVAATFKLIVYVEVRYGVGMWFDLEGGRKTIDPPIGLDPGGTHTYDIVVKNTGSTQDTFEIDVEEAREGWTQELTLDGEPVTSLLLDGGESALLEFRVKAPNTETAQQNIVTITAQSVSNALAGDVVNTATRIRPKVDLELALEPQTRLAEPNETVLFNITTRNKGNDVFTVIFEQDSILPKGWTSRLSVPEITLNPNPGNDPALNYVLQLFVTPPEGARAGDLASVKLAAEIDTGGAGGRVPGDEISAVVVVRRVYNLTTPNIGDAGSAPGETLRYVLPVTNHGNGQVALELLPGAVEATLVAANGDETLVPDWSVALDADDVTLDLNQSVDLPLVIEVPAGTPPGQYNITFTTRLSREALQNLTVPVNVRALSRVDFEGPSEVALTPGRPVTLAYTARNTGNVDDAFDLRANAPTGWTGRVIPERARLAPGERLDVIVELNASREAPNGDYVVRLESQSAGAPATPTDLRVDVDRPQLFLSDITATGDLRAGELVLVTANVGNRGGIEATNVSVALLVDGRAVDRILLARIPVGASSLATMSWVATQRGGDVTVILDPDEEIALASRDETAAAVEFGSTLGLPGPGVFALLAVVGLLAVTLRTSREDAKTRGPEHSRLRVFAAKFSGRERR